jgi:lipid A 3-O-deacylase
VLELLVDQYGESAMSSRLAICEGKLALLILFTLLFLAAPAASAQSAPAPAPVPGDRGPERGAEWEIWTGAGGDPIGTPKVTLGNSVWNVGFRYGWILTDAHGPGLLRGRFEYAVDALPAVMVFQPGGHAYGFGFDPWIMKWNFEPHRRISPYIELGGGGLITTRQVPLGENNFNFTPTGAIGVNILRGKYHWSIDFRYFHISDAQITEFNPGTDTFGLRVGWGEYLPAK